MCRHIYGPSPCEAYSLALINKKEQQSVLSIWLGKNRVFRECTVGAPSLEGIDEGFLEEVAYKLKLEQLYPKSSGESRGVI